MTKLIIACIQNFWDLSSIIMKTTPFVLFKCMLVFLNCNLASKSHYGLKLVNDLSITLKVQFIGLTSLCLQLIERQ